MSFTAIDPLVEVGKQTLLFNSPTSTRGFLYMKPHMTLLKGFKQNGKNVYICWCGALVGAWTKEEAIKIHKVHNEVEEEKQEAH